MNIIRSESDEQNLYSLLKAKLVETQRKDSRIHVGDLLSPRFAYFCKKFGSPPLDDETVGFFVTGQVWHKYLQEVIFSNDLAEKEVNCVGVVGTVDLAGDEITEIKTSRKFTVPEVPDDRHIRQLTYYMAMERKLVGFLLVVYFTVGRAMANDSSSSLIFRIWRFDLTEEDCNSIVEEIKECKDNLQASLDTEDFHNLPLCEPWMCGKVKNGKVVKLCPFYDKCKPMLRYPEESLIALNKRLYPRKVALKKKEDD